MTVRQKRILFVFSILVGVSLATGLTLYALNQNMNFFYSPSQVVAGEVPENVVFRVGGLVVEGSVRRSQDLWVEFALTDGAEVVWVQYTGILPDLFREGQGIVALGQLNAEGVFVADQVLAKHDENYMPPEVAAILIDKPAEKY